MSSVSKVLEHRKGGLTLGNDSQPLETNNWGWKRGVWQAGRVFCLSFDFLHLGDQISVTWKKKIGGPIVLTTQHLSGLLSTVSALGVYSFGWNERGKLPPKPPENYL